MGVKQKQVVKETYNVYGVAQPIRSRFVDPTVNPKAFFFLRIKQKLSCIHLYTHNKAYCNVLSNKAIKHNDNAYDRLISILHNIDYRNNAHNTHAYMMHSITYERMLT